MFGIDAAVVSAMTNHCPTDYRMHYSQTLKTTTKTKTLKLISPGKITSVLDIKDRKSIVLFLFFQKCLLQKKFWMTPPSYHSPPTRDCSLLHLPNHWLCFASTGRLQKLPAYLNPSEEDKSYHSKETIRKKERCIFYWFFSFHRLSGCQARPCLTLDHRSPTK